MIWHDLLFDRTIAPLALAKGFARAFSVSTDDVVIVDADDTPAILASGDAPILVEINPQAGEFAFGVGVILRGPEVEQMVATPAEEEAIIAELCRHWNAQCLFDDGTPSPYTYFRMHPSGEVGQVTLDPDALHRDEYVVWSCRQRVATTSPTEQR